MLSVEDVVQVVLSEKLHVLFVCNTKAVEEIVSVGVREGGGVSELGLVGGDVVALLDGLNNVAVTFELEELLGEDDIGVVDGHISVGDVTLVLVSEGGVTESTLIVGNGPGRG